MKKKKATKARAKKKTAGRVSRPLAHLALQLTDLSTRVGDIERCIKAIEIRVFQLLAHIDAPPPDDPPAVPVAEMDAPQ